MIITPLTALVINIREIRKICEIKIGLQDIIAIILTGIAAYLFSLITNRLFMEATPVLRAAAVVIASFGADRKLMCACYSRIATCRNPQADS